MSENKSPKHNGNGKRVLDKSQGKDVDSQVVKEFGGPIGCVIIALFSHLTVYYIWICHHYYVGALAYPSSIGDIGPFFQRMVDHVITGASPNNYAATIYLGFLLFQALLANFVPGFLSYGLPVPSEGNKPLAYKCNGIWCWYITLITVAVLHITGLFPITEVVDNLGPIISVAAIFSDVLAVLAYLSAIALGKSIRMSGNPIYDIFMGAWLNPRIGTFDLKFWAETRVAWILLFMFTLSAAVKQYEKEGTLSGSMMFMLLAHGLYANACMKGEECIPDSWDIFYEKWGWMLIFWNFCGVPLVYCSNSIYILNYGLVGAFPWWYAPTLMLSLLLVYWVWDTAMSQRMRWRMSLRGKHVQRKSFPQLPWGTLGPNAKYLDTKAGSKLLVDGWWKYARKIHYTCDVAMALLWGLSCGFNHFLPYFYLTFFSVMITHRYLRDEHRCSRKYGADWEIYKKKVPHVFIPYVI